MNVRQYKMSVFFAIRLLSLFINWLSQILIDGPNPWKAID